MSTLRYSTINRFYTVQFNIVFTEYKTTTNPHRKKTFVLWFRLNLFELNNIIKTLCIQASIHNSVVLAIIYKLQSEFIRKLDAYAYAMYLLHTHYPLTTIFIRIGFSIYILYLNLITESAIQLPLYIRKATL